MIVADRFAARDDSLTFGCDDSSARLFAELLSHGADILHETSANRDLRDAIRAAAEATDTDPSEKQRARGNYAKGKFRWNGLMIAIENPKGSMRSGVSSDGKEWSVRMPAHYGYLVGDGAKRKGADGDAVDVFVGPDPESELVFVINQLAADGGFNEHKVVLGTNGGEEAKQLYMDAYSPGWQGFGGMTALTLPQFKVWLMRGDMSRPLHESHATIESTDASGREHRGKGEGGGQFTSTGGGDAAKTGKEKTKTKKSENAKQPSKSGSHPSIQDIEIADDDDEPTGGRFAKPKATRLQLVSAQKVGTGDKSKIVLADGSDAPEHIQKLAGKIPPAWENVHISLDPESDVQALGVTTSKDGKQSGKALYSASYNAKTAELKFLRVADMMSNWGTIEKETQRDRDDPKKRDLADATWLMMEQATRPGSESDSKGTKKLWGEKMTAKNVVLGSVNKDGVFHPGTEDKKTGQPHVCLKFGDTFVPIKDDDARKELLRRVKDKQPLFDAKFWLKSHGATTLEGRNVVQSKDGVRLQFMGKESVWHDHLIRDPKLAKMLLERKEAAGEEGKLFKASAERVRKYVSHLDGGDYLTKDLRTARANFIANAERSKAEAPKTFDEYKQRVQEVAEKVAHVLGNRWQQSLETYIDPSIWTEWLASVPPETPKEPKPKKSKSKKAK